ncbi:MAG: hypothetical protein IPK19_00930 [Chloroflexi bacterium]|nr:hypothetical protein [Chloroflexota bacterium]
MAKRKQTLNHSDMTDALDSLKAVQQTGQMLFQREAERLARKHGPDDPRARQMAERAAGALETLNLINARRELKVEEVKPETKDEAVVYGRIAGDDLRGVSDLEITLEDATGRVMRAAGAVKTDAAGRFVLRVPPAVAEKLAGKPHVLTARKPNGEVVFRSSTSVNLEINKAVEASGKVRLSEVFRERTAPRTKPPQTTPPAEVPTPEPPVEKPRKPPTEDAPRYSVRGTVATARGKPAAGVLVRIYSQDIRHDDLLGAALTNADGAYAIAFRRHDFDAGGEKGADLHVLVVTADEQVLHSAASKLAFNAEQEAELSVVLEKQ